MDIDELLESLPLTNKLLSVRDLKFKQIDIEKNQVVYSVGGKKDLEVKINLQDFAIELPGKYELKGDESLFCYVLTDVFDSYKQKTEVADKLEAKLKRFEEIKAERDFEEITKESEEAFEDYIKNFKMKQQISKLNELIEDERKLGRISPEIAEKIMIKTEQTLNICILPREEYLEHVKIEYKGHEIEIEGFYPERGIIIIDDKRRRIKSPELYECVFNAYSKSKLKESEKNVKKE